MLEGKGLTYQQKIISIWEGTVTKIWDAIQFCRVIDNLFFWAQHCLKPKVTQYLSQWKLRYSPDVPKIHSLLETDTKTAEIVHRIQDRLSSLGLSPNEDLHSLVRQAVVFQEVITWSNEELNVDSKSKEQTKISTATISLPSHPRNSTLEVAPSSVTGSQQGTTQKVCSKGKEILHQESETMTRKNEKSTAESSKPHNTHTLQQGSTHKYQEATLTLSHKDKESAGENTAILEDTKDEHPIRSLLSYNNQALSLYPATSCNVLINRQGLNSRSPIISDANGRGNDKVLFSNQLQFKISAAEEKKSPLPRPSKEPDDNLKLGSVASRIENEHVIPLTKQELHDLSLLLKRDTRSNKTSTSKLLKRKGLDEENDSDRPIFPPNPYVSEIFELSFEVTPGLDLGMARPSLLVRAVQERMEYPWRTGYSHIDRAWVNLALLPIKLEPPLPPPLGASPLNTRIPWKGNSFIRVRLPPVKIPSVAIKAET